MCLLDVDGKLARKWGVGYKFVVKDESGNYKCFDHIPHTGTVTYPLNQWLTDPNDGDVRDSARKYRVGFHISLDKEKMVYIARGWSERHVIIRVKFRKVVATSCYNPDSAYGKQVVAREIMNLGEV